MAKSKSRPHSKTAKKTQVKDARDRRGPKKALAGSRRTKTVTEDAAPSESPTQESPGASGDVGFSDGILGEEAPPPASHRASRGRRTTARRSRRRAAPAKPECEPDETGAGSSKTAGTRSRTSGQSGRTRRSTSKSSAREAGGGSARARGEPRTSESSSAHEIDFDAAEYGRREAGSRDGEQASGVEETEAVERSAPRRRTQRVVKTAPSEERGATEMREMLINAADGDECRIALMRNGRLEELYVERATSASSVGNIYKARVTNVEPSIQAAFVDFGLQSHGFLHISDLHPKYFPDSKGEPEVVGKKTPRRHRPPIQSALRPGHELIVQVIKEGIGTKGPTLSSYISLPGRFLVMMPDMEQLGVSRKIEDEVQRRKLRDILGTLSLPKGVGFIVRTAGLDRTKRDLQRDLNYLTRLWKKVAVRIKSEPAPAELYKESDLVIRTIRDVYDASLQTIIVDTPAVADQVREFLSIASPRSRDIVQCYGDAEPMFHKFGIESEIDKLHSRLVPLPCGGSLVIEQTEALVAIDVNSGRFRVPENAEETAYRVNLEAADEIARQLRLRDLGGLIVLDLIDMMQERHRRAVERRLADALKKHKERAKILRISKFGILEMTRQRQRPSFAKNVFRDCPRCSGSGRVKAVESVALDVMRQIRLASHKSAVASIDVHVAQTVADDLLNRKRHALTDLERNNEQTIRIHSEEDSAVDDVRLSCTDRRGREAPGATGTGKAADVSGAGGARPRSTRSRGSKRGGRSRRSSQRKA